jgi:hypothetical protein
MKRAIALALSGAAVLALAGGALSTRTDPWKQLYRPLHIPSIEPGSQCPVSRADPNTNLPRHGFSGPAWGRGPAYPVLGSDRPVLEFIYKDPPSSWSTWGGAKVLWVVSSRYRGRVLIRGRRLDGPDRLRFDGGRLPPLELRIRTPPPGWKRWRDRPSFTRIRTPGCYAYQIDGKPFSHLIVFEAQVRSGG